MDVAYDMSISCLCATSSEYVVTWINHESVTTTCATTTITSNEGDDLHTHKHKSHRSVANFGDEFVNLPELQLDGSCDKPLIT
jgi:hypothetical protein